MQQRRIDPAADRAEYRQLADVLRAEIAAGTLLPGDQFPSESHLAQEFRVGVTTVRRGMEVLRREGLIETTKGVGSRVRIRGEVTMVELPKGAKVIAREATEDESRRLELREGAPVLVVTIGDEVTVYPGDQYEGEVPSD